MTPAIRVLERQQVPYVVHPYDYVEGGGSARAWQQLGVDPDQMVKTLVMVDETGAYVLVLMNGDRRVSTKLLAREIGCKTLAPCSPKDAKRKTGYLVGGTSPFGTKTDLPLYANSAIRQQDRIFVNAGQRGLLVEIVPAVLDRVLDPTYVDIAQNSGSTPSS